MARNPKPQSAAKSAADSAVPPPQAPAVANPAGAPSSGILFNGLGDLRVAETAPPTPPEAREYVPQNGEREQLKAAIQAGLHVCVVGPPGCGKSTLIHSVMAELGLNMVPFQCGRGITLDHLLGFRDLTQENGASVTNVVPGPLMRSMVHGAVFYPDELDTLDDGVAQHLGSAMDFRRELAPPEWRGIVIRGQPGFQVVSSTNADFIRDGRALPEHIRDRFDVFIYVEYLPPAREVELVVSKTGAAKETVERIVQVLTRLREAKKEGNAAGKAFKAQVSTRAAISWAKLVRKGLSPRDAGALALLNKIPMANPGDRTLANDTLDAVFPAEQKNLQGAADPDEAKEERPRAARKAAGKHLSPQEMRESNMKKFMSETPSLDSNCRECGNRNGEHNAETNQCPGTW